MDSTELLEASYVLDPFDIESEVTHVPEVVAVAVSDFMMSTELLEVEYFVDPLEVAL